MPFDPISYAKTDVRILEDGYIKLFKACDPKGLKVWTYARDLVYAGKLTWDDVVKFANDVKNADILAHEFNKNIYFTDDEIAFILNSANLAVDKAASILNSANLAVDKGASIFNSANITVDRVASIFNSANITSSKVRQILLNPNLSAMRTAEIFAKLSNTRKNEIATYVDEFDTLNTDYWTHREGTSQQVSNSAAYSGSSGLRLYYDTDKPYHTDVGHEFAVPRNEVIVEFYWRNTSSDTSDPDRGGLHIEPAFHETNIVVVRVHPDKIDAQIEGATKTISGSFTNVWKQITVVIKPDNTAAIAIDGVCEFSGTVTNTAGAVRLGIAGFSHEEHLDLFRIIEPS